MRSLAILGVRVDDVTYEETISLCGDFIQDGGPHLIATVNTEFVMAAQRDASFRRLLNSAALTVPDGIGLLAAARLSGHGFREHVRGTDLVERLVPVAARNGWRLFFLGGREGVAAKAAQALTERAPGLQVAGCYEGAPGLDYDDETLAAIQAAGQVDILLVAYGAPAQEKWLARNLAATGAPVGIGVGGVFDFFAGRAPRAPVRCSESELEWLYRLLTPALALAPAARLYPSFAGLVLVPLLTRRRGPVREFGRWRALGRRTHQADSPSRARRTRTVSPCATT